LECDNYRKWLRWNAISDYVDNNGKTKREKRLEKGTHGQNIIIDSSSVEPIQQG
jgi:hypothetical protein